MARITRSIPRASVQSAIAGIGRRITRARLELAVDIGQKVSQEDFGRHVGHALGHAKGITGATISRWESEETIPDLMSIAAIATVAGVDPGWLAFGTRSQSPSPDQVSGNPEQDASKNAIMAIHLAAERTRAVYKEHNAVMRSYRARFNRSVRDFRAAQQIIDPAERGRRVTEALAQREAVEAELDVITQEFERQLGEAVEIPRQSMGKRDNLLR